MINDCDKPASYHGHFRRAYLDYKLRRLADVAPTVLDLLGLPQPPEMTGRSLIRAARQSQCKRRISGCRDGLE